MLRLLNISVLFLLLGLNSACTNIGGASKSSTSLANFLGFSELPEWYISARYTYPDSFFRKNDFGLPVHFRDVGEGDTIVLVHGELSSLHSWDRWVEILRQEFRVIAIDLPGSGLTGSPKCIRDPEEFCPDNLSLDYVEHTLTYLIEDLQLRNFHLVGASLGGYVAARYALANPDRIETLTLISPLGMQQPLPSTISYLDETAALSEFVQPATVVTGALDELYADPEKITQDALQRYLHLLQAPGARAINVRQAKLVKNLMEYGHQETLQDVSAKTLVMWGNADTWGNFEHAQRWVDDIPNSLLVEYKGVGHLAMEEHAEDSAYDLIAFINDEPLPTIEGLGRDSFSLQEAFDSIEDRESLFGPNLEQMEDAQ